MTDERKPSGKKPVRRSTSGEAEPARVYRPRTMRWAPKEPQEPDENRASESSNEGPSRTERSARSKDYDTAAGRPGRETRSFSKRRDSDRERRSDRDDRRGGEREERKRPAEPEAFNYTESRKGTYNPDDFVEDWEKDSRPKKFGSREGRGEGREHRERKEFDRKPFDRRGEGRGERGFSRSKPEGSRYADGRKERPGFGRKPFGDRKGEGEGFSRSGGRGYTSERRGRRDGSEDRPRTYGKSFGDGRFDREKNYGKSRERKYPKRQQNDGGKSDVGFRRAKGTLQSAPLIDPDLKTDSDGLIRLNKYMSNSGLCSRREADEYIVNGQVTVNGVVVDQLGAKINLTDEVQFKGTRLDPERRVYILLNKPKDYVTTVDDPNAKYTVMDLIEGACPQRVYPVGRLDRNSTGLLLLTNDGELTTKLTHPSHHKKKVYEVGLDRNLTQADMEALTRGVTLDDGETAFADAVAYIDESDRSEVGIEIHTGQNRVIRRMFESLGYKVNKLDRVLYAGLTKKNLPRGKWRFLNETEVQMLKMNRFE